MKTIGERLQYLRKGISRDKFALAIGVSKTTIVNYEKGLRSPDFSFLSKVLEFNPEIDPTWLLTGEGDSEKKTITNVSKSVLKDACTEESISENTSFDSLGMVEGMGMLTKIYTSADNVYIRAINANLMAFSDAVENKTKSKSLEQRVVEMEADMAEMKSYIMEMKRQEEAREKLPEEGPSSEKKAA